MAKQEENLAYRYMKKTVNKKIPVLLLFVRAFVRAFVRSFIHSFIQSFIHSFCPSLRQLEMYLFIYQLSRFSV